MAIFPEVDMVLRPEVDQLPVGLHPAVLHHQSLAVPKASKVKEALEPALKAAVLD